MVPQQGTEWAALRAGLPDASLVVAGDLNQDLGGRHYYGTKLGRPLLRSALDGAGLTWLTSTDWFSDGVPAHRPIDHVCAGARAGWPLTARATGWDSAVGGGRLGDHRGTLVELGLDQI